MTCNVFGGTLNLAQLQLELSSAFLSRFPISFCSVFFDTFFRYPTLLILHLKD